LIHDVALAGEPHGIMQLAAYGKRKGWVSRVTTLKLDYLAEIEERPPQLIAASFMSADYPGFKKAFSAIKAAFPAIPMIGGGPHPTFDPDCVEQLALDAVCVGEGDQVFELLLERVEQGQGFAGLPNIRTKGNPHILEPLAHLDELPFIERDFFYEKFPIFARFKLKSFFTSRGCPYRCTYCFNASYNDMYKGMGKILRKRPVSDVINEVLALKAKYPLEYIRFADDVFQVKADAWLEEFAERFPKEVGIPFYCLMHANNVDEAVVSLLYKAGCRSACMSIESGDPELRKLMLKRNTSQQKIIDAFDLFNSYGINMYTNSMLGIPGAGFEQELASLDLSIRCKPKYGSFTIITPYPGTQFHDICVEQGVLPSDASDEMLQSTRETSVLTCFNEQEKQMQIKLLKLGPVTVRFPVIKPLTLFLVQKVPDNRLFSLVYWFFRNYLFSKYIVPVQFGTKEKVELIWRTLVEDFLQLKKS